MVATCNVFNVNSQGYLDNYGYVSVTDSLSHTCVYSCKLCSA